MTTQISLKGVKYMLMTTQISLKPTKLNPKCLIMAPTKLVLLLQYFFRILPKAPPKSFSEKTDECRVVYHQRLLSGNSSKSIFRVINKSGSVKIHIDQKY